MSIPCLDIEVFPVHRPGKFQPGSESVNKEFQNSASEQEAYLMHGYLLASMHNKIFLFSLNLSTKKLCTDGLSLVIRMETQAKCRSAP